MPRSTWRDLLATDDGHTITGHAAVFDQPTNIGDMFDEVIERGAFDGCDFSDVLFSTNHDLLKIPLARSRNNTPNSTLQLAVDNVGLAIKAILDTENNMDAKALYSAVKRGDISGMSFIFCVAEERWDDLDAKPPAKPLRHLDKISKVAEVSAVNWPAYDGTDINARGQSALDSARARLDSLNERKANQMEALKLRAQILAKF